MSDWAREDTLVVLALLVLGLVCSVDLTTLYLEAPAFIVDNIMP